MEHKQTESDFEYNRLEQTIALANEQLSQARERNENTREAIITAKQELRENTSHGFINLYSGDDFEALAELNQYVDPITEKVVDYEEVEHRIVQLENMLQSPYFARIDFKFEDEDTFERIYIGRNSLKKDKISEPYIYDWRSPIASIFYRFVLGTAYYDAPGGRITGEVSLKRQYEIKKGTLEYFFDAEVEIVDEFLRKLLSQNTSSKMKTIVETIQKEQDLVIRDMETDLMMVQGVAGSGKTSIALHRAAYLMYQGLSKKLAADNILIISPNTLFEQYIACVLPELGETQVTSVILEEILTKILRGKNLQSRNQLLENLIAYTSYRDITKQSLEFKTSPQFLEILNRTLTDIPNQHLHLDDIIYGNQCIITKQDLKQKILAGGKETPLGMRLELIGEYVLQLIRDSIRDSRKRRIKTTEIIRIKEELLTFTKLDIEAIYTSLFQDEEYLFRIAEGIKLPANINEIIEFTKENLYANLRYYDDAAALAYLNLKIMGATQYKNIKQVVIDEAQDYYPLHFELFNLLFPKAKFTILGDINQTLEKQEDLTLYDQIRKIFHKKKSALATMDKSFRCTTEILQYSAKFLDHSTQIKSFNRSGEAPALYREKDQTSLKNKIISEIITSIELGYQSIGLICKTEKNARSLYNDLKGQIDIHLITSENAADLQGTLIMPVYMSKGLEFDAVLICDVNQENYHSEDDRKLLYISCTRALHRLNLYGLC